MQASSAVGARVPSLEGAELGHPDRSMHVLEITISLISLLTAFLLAAAR